MFLKYILLLVGLTIYATNADIGNFEEVFSWKEITFDIDGTILNKDQLKQTNKFPYGYQSQDYEASDKQQGKERMVPLVFPDQVAGYAKRVYPYNGQFYIKENNVPMGVERWRNRLFITIPRRRYGIPSALNYVDLNEKSGGSPHFKPYPDNQSSLSKRIVSCYRTRVDQCNRLWVVDNGLLEVPGDFTQVQQPALLVFDLLTNKELLRYDFKDSDVPSERSPAGLASIAVDVINNDCSNTFAYIPDLASFGLIVFSLKARDSWRVSHNYFGFLPTGGDFNIGGQQFQWNDGIFSLTLGPPGPDKYRTAYFHALASIQEFSVSTEVLRNQTLATRGYHGNDFKFVGTKGPNTQTIMHDLDQATGAMFFAEVSRNAVSCWNTNLELMTPANVEIIAQDDEKLIYPCDMHVTGDEVWFISNRFPIFIYSKLNFTQTNFRIFRGKVSELISGTMCAPQSPGGFDIRNPAKKNLKIANGLI